MVNDYVIRDLDLSNAVCHKCQAKDEIKLVEVNPDDIKNEGQVMVRVKDGISNRAGLKTVNTVRVGTKRYVVK